MGCAAFGAGAGWIMSSTAEPARVLRFTRSDRLEHWAQILTFVPLAVTGLVQRYPGSFVSRWTIDALGGIEAVRVIHRWFAVALMLAVVYHLGAIGYRRFVLGIPNAMAPTRADFTAARQAVAYIFGRRADRPQQGRYTFEEKVEYWSLVWGTAFMIVTGFLLWNPIASATFLPGSVIPAAKAAHGAEAVLAVLAIVVWHLYHVHVRHFNKSIFTGYLSVADMRRDHPLELAVGPPEAPPAEERRRRRRRYLPLYSFGALVMLAGIWLFVTFEQTAIETIEPIEDPVVFAPVTTTTTTTSTTSTTTIVTTTAPATTSGPDPATTTAPGTTVALAWTDVAPVLEQRCGACHGPDLALGGLSLATHEAALAGGNNGPVILPGDAVASPIVTIQAAGDHPGLVTEEELADLVAWIDAGAP